MVLAYVSAAADPVSQLSKTVPKFGIMQTVEQADCDLHNRSNEQHFTCSQLQLSVG